MTKATILAGILFICSSIHAQFTDKQLSAFKKLGGSDSQFNYLTKLFPLTKDSAEEKITSLGELLKQLPKVGDACDAAVVKYTIGYLYLVGLEDYTTAMRYSIGALQDFENCNSGLGILRTNAVIGSALQYSRNHMLALTYFKRMIPIAKQISPGAEYANSLNAVADCFVQLKKPDSGLFYVKQAIAVSIRDKDTINRTLFLGTLGEVYILNKQYDSARTVLQQSVKYAQYYQLNDVLGALFNDQAAVFYGRNIFDSAILYAHQAIAYAHYQSVLMDAYEWLYKSFEKKSKPDSAAFYYRVATDIRDSIFSKEKNNITQSINFQQLLREKDKEYAIVQAKKDYSNRLTLFIICTVLLFILITAGFLYRSFHIQKRERAKTEAAYAELKLTQAQLIQSEKMASLGQLTAGIAHEIQNPLNFVNNFSDVNKEMLEELRSEKAKIKSEEYDDLLNDIIANEEKINHHGKRADAIVKGMLQHSRAASGVKQPTDINAFCDEYLKLSYAGFRSKDISFDVIIKTDFDNSAGKLNIVPQDIGRVLLNVYNNAFYAVNEKKMLRQAQGEKYEPGVNVTTKRKEDKIHITVEDNGNGIAQSIMDKIFQPFFTTKPTGQGTGLGLSLAYDIMKAQGGDINVSSVEGEQTTFVILLPVNSR